MKRSIYLFLTLLFTCNLWGETNTDQTNKQEVIISCKTKRINRPRIPSHQRIEAYFEDNILHIEFLKSEGKAYIEFLNQTDCPGLSESFDTAEPFDLEVEDITFPAEFEISTQLLNTYSGIISENNKCPHQ